MVGDKTTANQHFLSKVKVSATIFILAFAVSACVILSPTGLQDLQLLSVENVDANYPLKILQGENLIRKKILKVTFSSRTNLLSFTNEHDFTLYALVFLDCTETAENQNYGDIDSFTKVFDSRTAVPILPYMVKTISKEIEQKNKSNLYYIYVPVMQKVIRSRFKQISYPSYDLRAHPVNICFRLQGGDMIGRYFTSNVIEVPRDIISKTATEN